ncbi:hypothetical protein E3H11_42640 [Bradyrhizobium brasilense]|uniref:hypothetical protein n=1 Tax=Bradyrhizobium brasilense TaxID=1419277 RepID=UPI001456DC68|nr:hypothetical protein [Bradyrhizobium brasilense]NLS75392.1 hypothetical protein [Bradyrhizobium brasilense]
MTNNLPSKLESFLDMMRQEEDLARHGFDLLTKRPEPEQYFDALRESGFFDPKNNSGPAPSANPELVYIPFWHALNYLRAVAERAVVKNDNELVEKLLQVIRDVSSFKDPSTGNPRDNYHTYYRFAEIVGVLPLSSIKLADIRLMSVWLSSKFDRGLVAVELSKGLLTRLLASDAPDSIEKMCALLEECMVFEWVPEEKRHLRELVTVVDDYWLREILNTHARAMGAKAGIKAVLVFEKGLRSIFSDKRRNYGSTLWRPAIETSSQNLDSRAAESRFIEGMRDALDGWIEAAPEAACDYVTRALRDDAEIIRRIALHAVTEHFDLLGGGFEEVIRPKLFTSGHRHELYRLLSVHFGELSAQGRVAVADAIRNLPLPATGDDREQRLKYTQRDWLSAIKNHPEGVELFAEFAADPQLGPLSEHPDFLSYHEMRSGPGPTPFGAESLIAFAEDGSLVERLNGFTEIDSWRGPTLGGLVAALQQAVASQPNLFLPLLSVFHGAKAPFQHALIQGFNNVFNLPKDQQPDFDWEAAWPKLMTFFTECIADPEVWSKIEEKERIDLVPTRDWMRSLISGFLEAATRHDETAYPEVLLPQGLALIRALLDGAPASELNVKDPMSSALNTEKGRAIGALYNHALRACRLAKSKENSTDSAWATVKDVFDAEMAKCRDANYEFSTLTASYIANLEFMNYPWLVSNAAGLFPMKDYPNNFIVAIGGLAYASPSRRSYQLLASNGVFDAALSAKLEDQHGRDRVIEWISLAYLWDDEELDSSIVRKVFAGGAGDLETVAEFFWSVRGDNLTDKQRLKVVKFWDRCLTWAGLQARMPEQLMARLSRLSPYLTTLDDEGKRLLLAVVPYVHNDYATDQMVEEIARLTDSNPPAAAEILERMLEAGAPSYDIDNKLKELIEKLAAFGLRDAAIRCAEKLRKTLPGMLDLYKRLSTSN